MTTTLALNFSTSRPLAQPLPTPALRRSHSLSSLPAIRALNAVDAKSSAPHRPEPVAPQADLSLRQKGYVFGQLLRKSVDYRDVMLPAWVHSFGNGTLSGCFIGVFGRLGSFTPAQSFMAYALVESGQMFMYGLLNIYGAHKRDQAGRTEDTSSAQASKQRESCKRDVLSMCLVDAAISGALIVVTGSLHSASVFILPALLAVRLTMTCKNAYENNLFTCLRQLGRDPAHVATARSAGQALLGMETMVGMISYHAAGLAVQYLFLASAASAFAPLTMAAVLAGACITTLPKLYVGTRPS